MPDTTSLSVPLMRSQEPDNPPNSEDSVVDSAVVAGDVSLTSVTDPRVLGRSLLLALGPPLHCALKCPMVWHAPHVSVNAGNFSLLSFSREECNLLPQFPHQALLEEVPCTGLGVLGLSWLF